MKISNAVIEEISSRIQDMLESYQTQLDEAYLRTGEDQLSISIGAKVSPDNARLKVVTSISFVKEKVSDKITSFVDEEQASLFDNERG